MKIQLKNNGKISNKYMRQQRDQITHKKSNQI